MLSPDFATHELHDFGHSPVMSLVVQIPARASWCSRIGLQSYSFPSGTGHSATIPSSRGEHTFLRMGTAVNIPGSATHRVSAVTFRLCVCNAKAS